MIQLLSWVNQLQLSLSPTEKVDCLQVTNQPQEFLNHFPPKSIEKAFEQINQVLQVLVNGPITRKCVRPFLVLAHIVVLNIITSNTARV